jgi:hypothetical protein
LAYSHRKFEQFKEPLSPQAQPFFMWNNGASAANFPVTPSKVANTESSWYQQPAPVFSPHVPQQHSYHPWHARQTPASAPRYTSLARRETLWEEFKRIYITEVIAFTMSKSTLFTLIFSFMFLGCIFFLSGFFTATNIYREQHATHETTRQHAPTETALLQGRPERIVNMGAGIAHATPKTYQHQGGVKVDHNARRPSAHVQKQIATGHSNYP